MIIHLRNLDGERTMVTDSRWRELLAVARRFGWEPLGTKLGEEQLKHRYRDPDGGYDPAEVRKEMESWNGTYQTGEGQSVSYADALNLAFALEEAQKKGLEGLEEITGFFKKGSFRIM
jgi:hypothetical protein